jgi:hypothetical protein
MSKQWDMLDICAERTTAAGVKQVLVIWRPTWEPVDQVSAGAVWDNWISEQKTFVAREKRVEDGAESAVDADKSKVVIKRGRGRPAKIKKGADAVLVKAAKAAVDGKKGDDVVDEVDDDDDHSGSDDDSSGDDGNSSDVDEDLKKVKVAQVVLTGSHAQAFVGTGKKVDKQPEAEVAVSEMAPKRGRGRPPKSRK